MNHFILLVAVCVWAGGGSAFLRYKWGGSEIKKVGNHCTRQLKILPTKGIADIYTAESYVSLSV